MSTATVSYTLTTASAATGLSERTIADAIRRGDLIAHYVTDRPSILARDLEAWIEAGPTEKRKAS